jgi:small subunit ribosomal protein S20
MPVTKQARKKLRQDARREQKNDSLRSKLKKTVKNTRKSPSVKTLSAAAKIIDKTAKKNVIHKNKAARLKSRLAKLASLGTSKSSSPKTKSKTK